MRMRLQFAQAFLVVAGICLLAPYGASANELLDRMLNLGGSDCGCDAKGGVAQKSVCATQKNGCSTAKSGIAQHGGKCGCGAAQKSGHGLGGKCGACQKGSSSKGLAQKNGCGPAHKGGHGKGGVAQHGGKGSCCCGPSVLDQLRDMTAHAHCKVSQSMTSLHCTVKSHIDRLSVGRNCCCDSGKGGKGDAKYSAPAPSYDAPPAYNQDPSELAPPPAPVLDPSA